MKEKCQWKRKKISTYLIYNVISFSEMAGKTIFFQEKEVEYKLVVKHLENLGYWESLLLFWMMLNKASAYLYILGNDIYTGENSWASIYLFIVNNSNTKKRSEICSKLTIKSPQRRFTVFIVNFEHISYLFTPFSSVSTVCFEQVNVCWVPSYQFIDVEITYCCNY